MVFIVAWNEWSEGCTLEPSSDRQFEHLQTVRAVLSRHGQYRRKLGCGSNAASGASRLAGLATDVHKSTVDLQLQWTDCACGDALSSRAATANSSTYRPYFCGTVSPHIATDLEQQHCA